MIRNILVLGGGSAGLLAALTLRRRFPKLPLTVLRSSQIGVIGVGEGTTAGFPRHLFEHLKLKIPQFYAETQPSWKLGIRFLWGPRPEFSYTFSSVYENKLRNLKKPNGFYINGNTEGGGDIWSALMAEGRALPRNQRNEPDFAGHANLAFHIENEKLVSYLERRCADLGIPLRDGTVKEVRTGDRGVEALILEDGQQCEADLYVDASGFRSELLGAALKVEFSDFSDTLFCDRAVIGGWSRGDEPILPYTTAETMNAGWCWQIEHPTWINRGYVYSSRFISDEAALDELLAKNPKISNEPRLVKFRCGHYRQQWVKNVVAIGNAAGFVEPLEATALHVVTAHSRLLADCLYDSELEPKPSLISLFNRLCVEDWEGVRDFLAVHYRFNTRLDTPFWKHCREETSLGGAEELVAFYRENGPSLMPRYLFLPPLNSFGLEGYYAMLVGQGVPWEGSSVFESGEQKEWSRHYGELKKAAARGFDVKQAMALVHSPAWHWGDRT